ncbi:MAG: DNA-packaging protein [Gammaproteobacteria bacterium]|nr:DNA-packaging protein [Gammaproteobacteria bacterium]MBU1859363.1 DNA-packaging protein [Gammaproteobacteria bacterium]
MTAWLRILAPLLVYLACTLSAAFLGYRYAERGGELALEQLRSDHQALELKRAQAAAADAKAAAKRLQDEQARNDQLAADLAEQQRQYRQTTDRLTGEIARVNDLYRDALDAPPKPLPACVFTAGWVRIYDEATGAAVPAAADPGRTAAQVAEGHAAEQLDSGISQRAVLSHHVRYAEQCKNTAAQLDALIDAVQGTH